MVIMVITVIMVTVLIMVIKVIMAFMVIMVIMVVMIIMVFVVMFIFIVIQSPSENRTVVGFRIGSYASPGHLKTGPFENQTLLSGF
jgi:hypothetical protein